MDFPNIFPRSLAPGQCLNSAEQFLLFLQAEGAALAFQQGDALHIGGGDGGEEEMPGQECPRLRSGEGGAEKLLTDMSTDELLRFVALDVNAATLG